MMRFVLTIMLILFPIATQAASFDCARASKGHEGMICSNPELSRADEDLASAYKQALTVSNDQGALRVQQREWIKQRNSVGSPEQMLNLYHARISELQSTLPATPNPKESATEPTRPEAAQGVPSQSGEISATGPRSAESIGASSGGGEMARPVAGNDSPVPSPTTGAAKEDGNDKRKYLIAAALACCGILFAAYAMQANGAIIYVDYTDALFALCAVASLAILKTNTAEEKVVAAAVFVVLAFFPAKSAFTHNTNIWTGVLSLLAKFVAVGVLVIGVASLLSRPTNATRKNSETDVEYSARNSAHLAESIAIAAAIATFCFGLVKQLVCNRIFSCGTIKLSFRRVNGLADD